MTDVIPQKTSGGSSDNRAEIELAEPAHARRRYETARARLLDINHWGDMSGFLSASFLLTDEKGQPVRNRLPREGDHFRIRIPAPKPLDEYDWVRIEKIMEVNDGEFDRQLTAITVRPSADPTSEEEAVSHFFSDSASSTIEVRRDGMKVCAEVHGRNEMPNAEQPGDAASAIRNTIVATGALLGLSDMQWSKLVHGLLRTTKGD
jgi:hypothetical protein